MSSEEVNEEVKYFNVKNNSVRLVHIGGVAILPETVVPLIDDPLGVNRLDVESSDYLEETDEEVTHSGLQQDEQKPAVVVKAQTKKSSSNKTATGAGWSQKK